jgi:hypothetical protein
MKQRDLVFGICGLALSALLVFGGCSSPTVGTTDTGTTTGTITVSAVTATPSSITVGQTVDIVFEATVSGTSGISVDSVTLSGGSLSADVAMKKGSSTWTATVSVTGASAGSLVYTVTAKDSAANVTGTGQASVGVHDAVIAAASIRAFSPNTSNTAKNRWIDILVNDKAALASAAKIGVYNYSYDNTVCTDLTALPFWSSVVNGDVIRFWPSDAGITVDTAKTDNTAVVWDVLAESTYLTYYNYGAIYISVNSTVLDAVGYTTALNTKNYWLQKSASDTTELAAWTAIVNAGLWPSSGLAGALSCGTLAADDYMELCTGLKDGSQSSDWQAVSLALGAITVSPATSNVGSATDITVKAAVTASHVTPTVTVDLSPIGGSASVAMTYDDATAAYVATYTIPASFTTTGTFSLPVTATGSGITRSSSASYILTLPAPYITAGAVTLNYAVALAGQSVVVTVPTTEGNGADVSGVNLDLSSLGLGSAVAMGADPAGTTWTYTLTVPSGLAEGSYTISATAVDSTKSITSAITASATLVAGTTVPAFMNGDMETLNSGAGPASGVTSVTTFTLDSSVYSSGTHSLHIVNAPVSSGAGNKFVYISGVKMNSLPSTPKYLTFRFKSAASSGSSPGLVAVVGAGGTTYINYFNLTSSTATLPATASASYKTAITETDWITITLDLSTVTDATAYLTGSYAFSIKLNTGSTQDFYVDDFKFSN